MGGVLNQYEPDNKWHPVAFSNHSFSPAERNYDVHDKEMLAIVQCFHDWEYMLMSVPETTLVYTDHRNLAYFRTTKVLNRRQARWADYLSMFDLRIIYRPG